MISDIINAQIKQNEIFCVMEQDADGWRDIVAAYRNLKDAREEANYRKNKGRVIDIMSVILH